MRVTQSLAKGFFARSLDEFKRLSVSGMPKQLRSLSLYSLCGFHLIALTLPPSSDSRRYTKTHPYALANFHDPESLNDCKVMSDADIGGFSKAYFDWVPPTSNPHPTLSENKNGHVKFHGNISIELPPNRPHIQRSGYAAWRTHDPKPTIFGKSLWNIDAYAFLALRIKSDGRKYFVNLQTESIVPTDIHQHRLYARRPGEWETVLIKWNEFVRTNHGVVVEPQTEILRQKLRTVE
jgi:NADH dehydrogenase [ubiquinone] 1 alpha subcomplex assembly factor 1